MVRQYDTNWKDLKVGQQAKFSYAWDSRSELYVGKVGTIISCSASVCRIEFPDGKRMGPLPRQVIPISFQDNEEALKLLNTKGDGYD